MQVNGKNNRKHADIPEAFMGHWVFSDVKGSRKSHWQVDVSLIFKVLL